MTFSLSRPVCRHDGKRRRHAAQPQDRDADAIPQRGECLSGGSAPILVTFQSACGAATRPSSKPALVVGTRDAFPRNFGRCPTSDP